MLLEVFGRLRYVSTPLDKAHIKRPILIPNMKNSCNLPFYVNIFTFKFFFFVEKLPKLDLRDHSWCLTLLGAEALKEEIINNAGPFLFIAK